ncbi:rhomboid protease GluP [Desulfocicer vacuolatum DSM 3385]|uniref:Rhomboid protease GluP n=1 Tax=Desulfocicer vacuolatum DSM 3385 TaxID=1121400 RepID=A0A1W2DTY2_9BACT|nr:rhomboid family intramembrane serine protease [Desulfocicer vacuolatum]SMD00900.1 rhomboid protease GluP [Desulfocicer vacuolatum DSM 3385]
MRFPSPTSHQLIRAIIGLNGLMFLATLVVSGRYTNFSINPFTALSPSTNTLIFMGATGTVPIDHYREWWSLITASWLHGSLLHIIFNMTALVQIGHLVMETYGHHRMFIIYTVSGIAGFYLSYVAGVSVTIGASASICGLIGATLYYGKTRGGIFGQAVYKQTMGWVFSLIIFGFAIPGINNWGHGGGLIAGIGLGWLLGYHETKKEAGWHYLVSMGLMGMTILLLLWVIVFAIHLAL